MDYESIYDVSVNPILRRILVSLPVAVFGLALLAQMVEAKSSVVSVVVSYERGNYVSVTAGKKWAKKPLVVELGVAKGRKVKWTRIASLKGDASGAGTVCSSRVLPAKSKLRVRSGSKVVGTSTVKSAVTLSGCGYSPAVVAATTSTISAQPSTTSSTISAQPSTTSSTISAQPSSTTVASTSTTAAPTTTVAPTTTTAAPTTTTTTAPTANAPTALAMTAATDTGDSQSDGITKATTISVSGSAQAGATVQLYLDGSVSGSTCTADGGGAFECTLGTVGEGSHTVTAKATIHSLASGASSGLDIVVDRTRPTVAWSLGRWFIGANDSETVGITVSEDTTTLTADDVVVLCTIADGCGKANFTGSGRTYTVDFVTINNQANGGALKINAASFADVAGNANSIAFGPAVMYDSTGPRVTFTRVGSTLHIVFSERVFNFDLSDIMYTEMWQPGQPGWGFSSLVNTGNDGITWDVDVNGFLLLGVDSMPEGAYTVAIGGDVVDADGLPVVVDWWTIPSYNLANA